MSTAVISMAIFTYPSRVGPVFRLDPYDKSVRAWGHCKRYRATGPHRARVDMTLPTGGLWDMPIDNLVALCDTQRAGKKIVKSH